MALLLWSTGVMAQTSVLIVVRGQDAAELQAFEQRLRLELSAEGYSPATVTVTADPNAAVLLDTAKRLTTSAAISISQQDGGVTGMVWIVDPKKPGGLLRAVTAPPNSDQAPAVFAIAATDALHGGLLELGYIQEPAPKTFESSTAPKLTAPKPAPPEPSPKVTPKPREVAPEVRALTEPQPDTAKPRKWDHHDGWFLSFGVSRSLPLGDLPSSTELEGTFSRRLGTSFAVGLHVSYDLPFTLRDDKSEASATLAQGLAGARLQLIQGLGKRFQLVEQLDTGLHYFSLEGQAASPLTNVASHRFTTYHELSVASVFNVNSDFGIWFGAGLRLPYQPTDVIIVERVVGRIAGPTLLLGGGLQLRLL